MLATAEQISEKQYDYVIVGTVFASDFL